MVSAKPREGSSGVWIGVAIGLGIAAVAGVAALVVYVLRRRNDQIALGAPVAQPHIYFVERGQQQLAAPQPQIYFVQQPGQQAVEPPPRPELTEKTYARTVDLPPIENSNSRAVRVVQAPKDTPYQAEVQVVSPPGSFAVLSYDAATLNLPMQNGALPGGDTIIVPAGVFKPLFLAPGQVLYGKGANGGNPPGSLAVKVSVSAAQPAARIIPMRR